MRPLLRGNRGVLVAGLCLCLPLLAVLLLNLGRDPRSTRSPLIGQPAPLFSLAPVGGGAEVSLSSLRGRPVVVNFWATWCAPCVAEHATLAERARAEGDVQFLGVAYDDEEARVAQFLSRRPAPYPSLLDPQGRTAIAWGVAGAPETFFIDRSGRIVDKHVGPLDPAAIGALIARARGAAP